MNQTTNHAKLRAMVRVSEYRERIRFGENMTMAEQCQLLAFEAVCWQAALLMEGKRKWLSSGNPKLQKAQGWRNVGLTMSPEKEFRAVMGWGPNMCPLATATCAAVCVGAKTGQGKLHSSMIARVGRTLAFHLYGEAMLSAVALEADKAANNRDGLPVAMRSNVATDRPDVARKLRRMTSKVRSFYDYTAIPNAVRKSDGVRRVLSYKGPENHADCMRALAEGYGLAVVFDIRKDDAKPAHWFGAPVIDGDLDDVWFDRAPASGPFIVGLYLKGTNAQKDRARRSGFAVKV